MIILPLCTPSQPCRADMLLAATYLMHHQPQETISRLVILIHAAYDAAAPTTLPRWPRPTIATLQAAGYDHEAGDD